VKLELAKALWDARRDRPRAVALARAADAGFRAERSERDWKFSEEWLRKHARR
jgi:hypothetical protein